MLVVKQFWALSRNPRLRLCRRSQRRIRQFEYVRKMELPTLMEQFELSRSRRACFPSSICELDFRCRALALRGAALHQPA